jgi:hypothetical protein
VSVAVGIQHAKRMRHIILWSCPAVQYFSTLSHKRHDFKVNIIEHKMRVVILSTNLSEKGFVLRRTERDMNKNVYWASCKVPFISCQILMKLEFLKIFCKRILKYQISGKSFRGSRVIPCGRKRRQT